MGRHTGQMGGRMEMRGDLLYWLSSENQEICRMRAWPPLCEVRRPEDAEWVPTRMPPRNEAALRGSMGMADYEPVTGVEPLYAGLLKQIPRPIRGLWLDHGEADWSIVTFAASGEAAFNLCLSSPLMAHMLAYAWLFRGMQPEDRATAEEAATMAGRLPATLSWLGWPATVNVAAMLAKLEPEFAGTHNGAHLPKNAVRFDSHDLLLLRRLACLHPHWVTFLSGLPRLTCQMVKIAVTDELRNAVSCEFLQELSGKADEAAASGRVWRRLRGACYSQRLTGMARSPVRSLGELEKWAEELDSLFDWAKTTSTDDDWAESEVTPAWVTYPSPTVVPPSPPASLAVEPVGDALQLYRAFLAAGFEDFLDAHTALLRAERPAACFFVMRRPEHAFVRLVRSGGGWKVARLAPLGKSPLLPETALAVRQWLGAV